MVEIWTVGHWTCPQDTFLGVLRTADIGLVADVRAQPGSRTSPQFGKDVLPGWLAEAGIGYRHLPELGGRRPRQDVAPELNAGWQNRSFKNYADYTLTDEYEHGIALLTGLAEQQRVAYLCAEPMPWRCHRLLISNTLTARGHTVWHLIARQQPRRHELGRWGARPVLGPGRQLIYPPDADGGLATSEASTSAVSSPGAKYRAARGSGAAGQRDR